MSLLFLSTLSASLFAQVPFWSNNGNNAQSNDFLGTTNNQPLILKSNGAESMRLNPDGTIKFSAFLNQGSGFLWSNNGTLSFTGFTNDTSQVLTGNGTFKSISSVSGWSRTGNFLYSSPGINVGIGVTNQQYAQYPLAVNGDAWFNGTVYAMGIILTNKLQTDTLKASSMFSLNNNMHMSAGPLNQIYTSTGDLRFQSNAGYGGNTIFNAGTNGNVGIGTFSPQYKLDVTGQVRFVNDVFVSRLRPLPNDSVVIIGDSSIIFGYWNNSNHIQPAQRGIGIGSITAIGRGTYSTAIGHKVIADFSATNSVVIGSGVITGFGVLTNTFPNSMMIGFNSDIPTIFVAPANGAGTTGNVGIGGNTNPQYKLDVNGTVNATGFLINGTPLPWTINGNDIFFDATMGGSVGIGVAGPNSFLGCPTSVCPNGKYLLAVGGGIRCKALKVEPLWADYVFDSTYQLMPLDSVEIYIKTYGHLPGVPTAEDVAQNGIDVGETQAMLLAKVEELTLYMIEMQKKNEALQKEVDELKKDQKKKRWFWRKKR